MKMKDAVRLLKILPTKAEDAITVAQLAQKWYGWEPSKEEKRNIQRYVIDLSTDQDGASPLINMSDGPPRRFYLRLSQVANWFMTEEVALTVLLTRQLMGQSLESLNDWGASTLTDIAEKVTSASISTQRIRQRIRVIPDGIGRLSAKIAPEVLKTAIDAIAKSKHLNLTYRRSDGTELTDSVTAQGIVAKDGTLYLLGTSGLSDPPRHFAMQRIKNAGVSHRPSQFQPRFDLDTYIHNSHMLSHRLYDEPEDIKLELLVASDTIFHFRERPLSERQYISAVSAGGFYKVSAEIPATVHLMPFLLSMGVGVEVIAPAAIRKEIQNKLILMLHSYGS
jgi:predicted DNA-binding transcriptional regulator YafY